MTIDIKHYLKILNTIEEIEDEDGYRIVNLYLEKDFNDERFPKRVHNSILKKVTRNNKLSNSRVRQITYTLYMFNKIVTSDGIKQNVNKEINK